MKRAVHFFGPFLMALDAVQERFVATLEEVKIGYPNGPLTEDHGGCHGPAGGERMLDATVVRHDDLATVRLFDVARSTRWTCLLFSGTGPTDDGGRLAALAREVAAKFGKSVAVPLVADGSVPQAGEPTPVLLDHEHFLHDRYGVRRPCLYLIRPDWYVGFRGGLGDGDRLLAYLGRHLVALA